VRYLILGSFLWFCGAFLAAQSPDGSAPETVDSYLPHFTFRNDAWETSLTLANPTGVEQKVVLTVYDDAGQAGPQATLVLPAKGGRSADVRDLFEHMDFEAGWLRITSETPTISGLMTFTFKATKGTSSVPTVYETGRSLLFPLLVNDETWVSGFAVTNVTSNSVLVELTVNDMDGNRLDTASVSMAPHSKLVDLIGNMFAVDLPEKVILRLEASKPVTAFGLTLTHDNGTIVAVPATVLD